MSKDIPVHVVAQPEFLGRHEDKFAFAYTIYITNHSEQNITLRNRHWIITHANGSTEEVIGDGVIGKTPELAPGKSYSYTSGALIPHSGGFDAGFLRVCHRRWLFLSCGDSRVHTAITRRTASLTPPVKLCLPI